MKHEMLKQARQNARDRHGNKITAEAVAKAFDVDRTTVFRWESGHTELRIDQLEKLSKIYDCTVYDLGVEDTVTRKRAG